MKRKTIILIIVVLFIISIVILFLRSQEDSWIKDSRGIYIKHGNPASTPSEVLAQKIVILGAMQLYNESKTQGMLFNSQCLGVVDNGEMVAYSVDIVHVPRINEDNLSENQCPSRNNFIELDYNGNIVKIV